MPQFNNMEELQKFLNGGKAQSSTENIKKRLIEEAKRLEEIIRQHIQKYLESYFPVEYRRTGAWMDSIRVGSPVPVAGGWQIKVDFEPTRAYHPSYIDDEQPHGYVPWLMESGWSISNKVQPRIYRFTDFEGTHYLTDAVEEWNSTNSLGLKITVLHNGEEYLYMT